MSLEQRPETQTPRAVSAAVTIGSFVALLYVIEFAAMLLATRLDRAGFEPRETDGPLGLVFAPTLPGGWGPLIGHPYPPLVRGLLLLLAARPPGGRGRLHCGGLGGSG